MDTTRGSLLVRIKDRGDSVAWRDFDTIYRPMLIRYALARGLKRTEAEDVAQHCMIVISRQIEKFDYDPSKGRFKGWLRTLVNNRVRNLYRRRPVAQAGTKALDVQQVRETSPEELFDHIWMAEHLRHCLDLAREEIEPTTYAAFMKYVIEEQPVDVVCRDLNMSVNQVHLIKWRVTRRLAEKMRAIVGDEE